MCYTNIVNALYTASCNCIPRKRHNFYKYWWDQELSALKENAIQSFNIWSAMGKPRTGAEFDSMRFDKLRYKRTIKAKEADVANQFSDSLNDALIQKNMDAFWNSWRSKFGKGQVSSAVDGCCDEKSIADKFATVFSSVCVPNSPEKHDQHRIDFNSRFAQYIANRNEHNLITVQLVEKCIRQLKKGKAAGTDHLTTEHISFAHPLLVIQLSLLFRVMLKHGVVPDSFGHGIVIPLVKNQDGDRTTSSNYRGITLSPVISKLFEMVLMILFDKYLQSNPLQFGFKKGSSTSHALFTLKTVTEHYVNSGSTVNLCALDIAKAFDRVDHYALLKLLMDRQVSKNFIEVLHDWLTKCYVCVRWGGAFSFWFGILAGVRQGGCLSPILFAIYMDVLIVRLKASGYGCQLYGVYFGCLLYADDIMLLSHSLSAMRCMLQICDDFATEYDIRFNTNKSVAMRIGVRHNAVCEPFVLSCNKLMFVQSVKYLGIILLSDKKIKYSIDHLKVKFYRVFNCIYCRSRGANSELVSVELLKSFCLPGILYAAEAISFTATDIRMLDNCVNRALYKIFGLSDKDNLLQLRQFIGLSSLSKLIEKRRCNFMDRILGDSRYSVLCDAFVSNLCSRFVVI